MYKDEKHEPYFDKLLYIMTCGPAVPMVHMQFAYSFQLFCITQNKLEFFSNSFKNVYEYIDLGRRGRRGRGKKDDQRVNYGKLFAREHPR